MGIKFTGAAELNRNIAKVAQRMPYQAAVAMYAEASIEMLEAKRRTPVKTGALRASGHVTAPELRMGSIRVALNFGNASVGYAVPVHEDVEAYHRVGQAKYLESTLRESAPFLPARIARRMNVEGLV